MMTVAEKQQNILNFREFEVYTKCKKNGIFGKLTGGFENFLYKAKKTNKNAFLGYGKLAHTPFDSFGKFHKQKSYQFAVLPSVRSHSILNISKTTRPIAIKFYLKHH